MESVPGIREQGPWLKGQEGILGCGQAFLGLFSPPLQERQAGSQWERRRGKCLGNEHGNEAREEGQKDSHLRLGIFYSSKELKDPDQLYTTLKNLLAQIKVGGQALFRGH